MMTAMQSVVHFAPDARLQQIALARQAVLLDGKSMSRPGSPEWIEHSWQRCLASGKRPHEVVSFDLIEPVARRRLLDTHHALLQTARPVLQSLAVALASTRYFAILTNAQGVVIDAQGAIDRSDRRADLISRIGTDLSEGAVATTAISAALSEQQPIWLHRGEHFYDANCVYSCAGAPVFGPNGDCIGMLDLTGIEAAERPELKHLVAQSARGIENALTLNFFNSAHDLLIRLNWPGRILGDESDGLVCLDADGYVTAANQMARLLVPQLASQQLRHFRLHANELFDVSIDLLFDAARRHINSPAIEMPLRTGFRLHAMPICSSKMTATGAPQLAAPVAPGEPPPRLKDIQLALIRKAVDEARGNVQKAAKALGISRATVYRRLGSGIKK